MNNFFSNKSVVMPVIKIRLQYFTYNQIRPGSTSDILSLTWNFEVECIVGITQPGAKYRFSVYRFQIISFPPFRDGCRKKQSASCLCRVHLEWISKRMSPLFKF